MKHLPNLLTAARLPLALAMLFFPALSAGFIALYLLCCLTDVLDGYFARRLNVQSEAGARLDSMADLLLTAVLIWMLWPVVSPGAGLMLWIAGIAIVRFLAAASAALRFGVFGFLHMWGNKLTGVLIALYPLSLLLTRSRWPLYLLCTAATLSALEELAIELTAKEWHADRKGIFAGTLRRTHGAKGEE